MDTGTQMKELLGQDVIKEILNEIYEKAQQNEVLLAKDVIGEMVQKLKPFFNK